MGYYLVEESLVVVSWGLADSDDSTIRFIKHLIIRRLTEQKEDRL